MIMRKEERVDIETNELKRREYVGRRRGAGSSKFDPRVPRLIKKKLSLLCDSRPNPTRGRRSLLLLLLLYLSLAEVWTVCASEGGRDDCVCSNCTEGSLTSEVLRDVAVVG
jgi:hypothetical protein